MIGAAWGVIFGQFFFIYCYKLANLFFISR